MRITLIAAHDPNLVIGNNGQLPWHYSEDLKHFKQTTTGHTIIMGRGVFEEINEKPLPNRTNIVLSRTQKYNQVQTFEALEEALKSIHNEEVFIIGGGVLYKYALPFANKMVITLIKKTYEGDTYFPEYRNEIGVKWKEVSREENDDLAFIEYERIDVKK